MKSAQIGMTMGVDIGPDSRPMNRRELNAKRMCERDPSFGIKSNGRGGAGQRMQQIESRRRKHPATLSNPFKHKARRDAFDAAVVDMSKIAGNLQWVRKQAMKTARRVQV
jgi:hypothetical protein